MLFRQLEYFVAVAEERHFARAAEKCYVSQPALSAAIAKLERELDVTLIKRGRSFEGLTPEGERLLVWAKRILAEHDIFRAELRAMQSGEIAGTLRLGTIPTASTTSSLVISSFCSAHPRAKVQIRSQLATSDLYRRLRAFELDAAIAPVAPEESQGLDVVPLYEDRYVFVVPTDMLAEDALTLRWVDAGQYPLALLTPDMRVRQVIDATFAHHGITVSPQVETDSVSTLLAQSASGDRACIVPQTWLWTNLMSAGLRAVELVDPSLETQIAAAVNSKGPRSPLARAFVASAQHLKLGEFFAKRLGGLYRR
ncbi:LysR family transcriptional regulator [Mycobacterium noviomagense]|uniref:Probable hydrogen peroxide-inducible genes activator n=1 Tax=Mycobacterium noviomagense TaxID=459858 RepID=A0A7I7PDP4_9MYCO|nr:LysR family transcriptional regulator [Mycobacterium noviomagense]ORB12516.1 LysR family transcriptional regulator [Mycobacterium noviomagense]BBY06666.1 LysR family transcriptional regulator [Mycobacterium noviomagense]